MLSKKFKKKKVNNKCLKKSQAITILALVIEKLLKSKSTFGKSRAKFDFKFGSTFAKGGNSVASSCESQEQHIL
jgi:hypothetical protein